MIAEKYLQEAKQAQEKNNFNEAKKILLSLLDEFPENVEAMHRLAFIYTKQNLNTDAEKMFAQALDKNPNSAILHNHYGLFLYRQNLPQQAKKQFTHALKIKPDYFDAMVNLSLTLKKLEKTEESIACLISVAEIEPQHIRAHFFLGKFLLEKDFFEDADKYFQKVVALAPNDSEILEQIVKCWLGKNRYQEAKACCEKLIEIQPNNTEILYNLAIIESRLNQKQQAVKHYQTILQISPSHFPALNNIAILYLEKQNLDAAKHYFQQALKQQPDNESIKHTLNAITGKNSSSHAPQDYIKNLFDGYADHFEQHLREGLNYRVPELLKENVEQKLKTKASSLHILDLGCGTGLCGEVFKPLAKHLVGVDLSPKMIAIAKQKDLYNELIVSDNLEYLTNTNEKFDLLLAADVLPYQGDLNIIFPACHKTLKEKGLFAFSAEIHSGKNFSMQTSGRFCHSKQYIKQLAKKIGFKVLSIKTEATRLQQDQALRGYIFILQKAM
jgi:predicted TPR repeat methyltransferase